MYICTQAFLQFNHNLIDYWPKLLIFPCCRSLGFSVEETVDALNALAKHDENKRRMVKAGVIAMYMFIMKVQFYISKYAKYDTS